MQHDDHLLAVYCHTKLLEDIKTAVTAVTAVSTVGSYIFDTVCV